MKTVLVTLNGAQMQSLLTDEEAANLEADLLAPIAGRCVAATAVDGSRLVLNLSQVMCVSFAEAKGSPSIVKAKPGDPPRA